MLKKLWANRIGALIVLLCAYLLVFGFISTYDEPIRAIQTDSGAGLPVIILDAGHGGIDSGCVSINGAVVTRDSDKSIHDIGITGLGKQKKSDMENRLKIVNSVPNAIFVSVHQNQFTDPKYYGAQMFYPEGSADSERLAGILQHSIVSNLQPENQRETKPVGDEIYLLHFAKCPAVMAECGFLSNQAEADKLESEEYQSMMAFSLFEGICEYVFSMTSDI